jgi:hypothetical protein
MIRREKKFGAKIYYVNFSNVNLLKKSIVTIFTTRQLARTDDDEKMKTVIKAIIMLGETKKNRAKNYEIINSK